MTDLSYPGEMEIFTRETNEVRQFISILQIKWGGRRATDMIIADLKTIREIADEMLEKLDG